MPSVLAPMPSVLAAAPGLGKCFEVNLPWALEPEQAGLTFFQNIYFTISLTRGRRGRRQSESLPR